MYVDQWSLDEEESGEIKDKDDDDGYLSRFNWNVTQIQMAEELQFEFYSLYYSPANCN